jgi:hypothetical protein
VKWLTRIPVGEFLDGLTYFLELSSQHICDMQSYLVPYLLVLVRTRWMLSSLRLRNIQVNHLSKSGRS